MKDNRYIKRIVIFFITFAIAFPIVLKVIYNNVPYPEWYNVLAGFVGGAIGGITTLIALYVSTNETRKIQLDSAKSEEKREKDKIKENALIVYYDLFLGMKDIKKLFLTKHLFGLARMEPKRMYFSSDWIQNTAALSRNDRIRDSINYIYTLYGELLTIRDFLRYNDNSTQAKDNLIFGVDKIASKILKSDIYSKFNNDMGRGDALNTPYGRKLLDEDVSIEDFLNEECIKLLEKIKLIAYDKWA